MDNAPRVRMHGIHFPLHSLLGRGALVLNPLYNQVVEILDDNFKLILGPVNLAVECLVL